MAATMTRARCWWTALLTLAVLVLSVSAPAQDDATKNEARRLYGEARKAMADKQYREAALGFEASSKLHPHAVSLYTAAQAWELAGEPGRAADAYSRALATPKLSDSQAARSRDRLAELEQKVGTVVVIGNETTRVQLDDHMEVTAPARLHGAPGDHTLKIARADGSSEQRQVTLAVGEAIELDAEAKEEAEPEAGAEPKPKKVVPLAEPAKRPVKPEKENGSSTLRTIGFITAGAGLAALGGAAMLGMSAKDAEDTYKDSPTRATFDHAKSLETRTNVMFVVGGVLTAAGVGLVVWQSVGGEEQPTTALRVRAGAGSLWAEGSF